MFELFGFIEKNWDVVSAAPFLFGTFCLLSCAIGWGVARYMHSAELRNTRSRVELLEARNNEYERKLDVSSPEEAKEQIIDLQNKYESLFEEMSQLRPKQVSEEQKERIISAIAIGRGNLISIVKDAASQDAAKLSSGLVDAFIRGGWRTETPLVMGLGKPPPSGVSVAVPQPSERSVEQQSILNALEAAGIRFDVVPANPRSYGDRETPIAEVTLTTAA